MKFHTSSRCEKAVLDRFALNSKCDIPVSHLLCAITPAYVTACLDADPPQDSFPSPFGLNSPFLKRIPLKEFPGYPWEPLALGIILMAFKRPFKGLLKI